MVWELDRDSQGASVLPTDSGGIWHDHIVVDPPFLDDDDKATFVMQNTVGVGDGMNLFESWLRAAFANPYEYVADLSPPLVPALSRIVQGTPPNFGMAWSWELRVECTAMPNLGIRLSDIFWSNDDFLVFRTFIRDTIPDPHYNAYLNLLATVSRVYPTLNEATQQARAYVAGLT